MVVKVLGSFWRVVLVNLVKEDVVFFMVWVGGYGNKKIIVFEIDYIGE